MGGSVVTWTLRICAIILSLTAFYVSWNGLVENRRFETHGQRVPVEPIEKYTEKTTTRKKLGIEVSESKSHSAEIFFTTLEKQRIRVNRSIPGEVLAAFLSGSEVYIEYLPEEPTTTRFEGHGSRPVLSASFGLLIGALTWVFWRKM